MTTLYIVTIIGIPVLMGLIAFVLARLEHRQRRAWEAAERRKTLERQFVTNYVHADAVATSKIEAGAITTDKIAKDAD